MFRKPRLLLCLLPPSVLFTACFLYNATLQMGLYDAEAVCHPRRNIAFLKTHKSAGSSVQNVLLRYGETHGLNFVLPRAGNYLGHPARFSRHMVNPAFTDFNILAHHARLDYAEMRALLPRDTVFVTIVRDPVRLFESSFSYYDFSDDLGADLHEFIRLLPDMEHPQTRRFRGGKFGANQLSFDLGGDVSWFENETWVRRHVADLDAWFDLVLVAERMEESLVLFRHLMCWDVEDVVAFRLNKRDEGFRSSLNESETQLLRHLNAADVQLYEHFARRLQAQVMAFGPQKMAEEVRLLRDRTDAWYSLCVKGEERQLEPPSPRHYHNPTVVRLTSRSDVTNATCARLTRQELDYSDLLRDNQMRRHPESFVTPKPKRRLKHKKWRRKT